MCMHYSMEHMDTLPHALAGCLPPGQEEASERVNQQSFDYAEYRRGIDRKYRQNLRGEVARLKVCMGMDRIVVAWKWDLEINMDIDMVDGGWGLMSCWLRLLR